MTQKKSRSLFVNWKRYTIGFRRPERQRRLCCWGISESSLSEQTLVCPSHSVKTYVAYSILTNFQAYACFLRIWIVSGVICRYATPERGEHEPNKTTQSRNAKKKGHLDRVVAVSLQCLKTSQPDFHRTLRSQAKADLRCYSHITHRNFR